MPRASNLLVRQRKHQLYFQKISMDLSFYTAPLILRISSLTIASPRPEDPFFLELSAL